MIRYLNIQPPNVWHISPLDDKELPPGGPPNPEKLTIMTGMHVRHRTGKEEPCIEFFKHIISRSTLLKILIDMSDMENGEHRI